MILNIYKYYLKFLIALCVLSTFAFSQKKVACIGNSITFGSFLSNPSVESYPAQLQHLLGSQYIVTNYGAPGRTLLSGFSVSYDNSTQFYSSIAHHNDIIIIVLGTNDTQSSYRPFIDNFIGDYKALISKYDNFPSEDIPYFIIGLPPPIYATYDGHSNEYLVNEIIPRINTVINQTNNITANFYNALEGKPELFIDGIHTTVEGANIMAKTAKNAIDRALNPAPETPTNFSAIGSINFVTLTWTANSESDLHHYNLFKGTVLGGVMNFHVTIPSTSIAYVDNDVVSGRTYYYQISAVNSLNNESLRTSQISATPTAPIDVTPPATPTNFTALPTEGKISLSWNPNSESDLANYNIYRGTIDGGWKDYLTNVDKIRTSYDDTDIIADTTYFYQISAQDNSANNSSRSNQISATTLCIYSKNLPAGYSLEQNYPNPFNPYTKIEYNIPVDCNVSLTIYDLIGKNIKSLFFDYQQHGHHSIKWDGTDNSNHAVCCGTYFYQIKADFFIQTRKMILLK